MTKPMPLSIAASGSSVASASGREAPDREVGDDVEAEHPGEQDRDRSGGSFGPFASATRM